MIKLFPVLFNFKPIFFIKVVGKQCTLFSHQLKKKQYYWRISIVKKNFYFISKIANATIYNKKWITNIFITEFVPLYLCICSSIYNCMLSSNLAKGFQTAMVWFFRGLEATTLQKKRIIAWWNGIIDTLFFPYWILLFKSKST